MDFSTFEDNPTQVRTIRNIRKTLEYSLKEKYGIEDKEVTEKILAVHGLAKDQFDFVGLSEKIITEKLNDNSIDDNSNKNEKTIEGVIQEVVAPIRKALGYDFLYQTMKKLYGKHEAKRLSGELYDLSLALSDSTKILNPYCWAFDASKIVLEGRPFGQLKSKPPKRIESYVSALDETVHQLSNHLAGAVAVGTLFFDFAHVLYFKEGIDLEQIKTNETLKKRIENAYQTFVHSINHLSRSAIESPFTNISLFDRSKLRYLISEMYWYFDLMNEDGSINEIYKEYFVEYIMELQNIFLDFFDKGDPSNGGLPYRFPVVTLNLSKKKWGNDWTIEDKDFLTNICKRDIYRYNIFTSEGIKTASCCFKGDEILEITNPEGIKELISIRDFVNEMTPKEINSSQVEKKIENSYKINSLNPDSLNLEETNISGVLRKKNSYEYLITIEIDSGLEISVTPDHIFLVKDIVTNKIETVSALEINKNPERYLIPIED